MLSVLAFKSSLFSGVLDGGAGEIQLGGTRLSKFMETVEATTAEIPTVTPAEREEAAEAKREFSEKPRPAAGEDALADGDPWAALLRAGTALIEQFTRPAAGGNGKPAANGAAASLVRTDEKTGEPYLRLPVPPPQVLEQALGALQKLLSGLKG